MDSETRIRVADLSYLSIFKIAGLSMFFAWTAFALLAFVASYGDEGPIFNGKPVDNVAGAIAVLMSFIGGVAAFSLIFSLAGALVLKIAARWLDFGAVRGRAETQAPHDPFAR